jgi:hypothetical protein
MDIPRNRAYRQWSITLMRNALLKNKKTLAQKSTQYQSSPYGWLRSTHGNEIWDKYFTVSIAGIRKDDLESIFRDVAMKLFE